METNGVYAECTSVEDIWLGTIYPENSLRPALTEAKVRAMLDGCFFHKHIDTYLPHRKFDAVICSNVLHYLNPRSMDRTLKMIVAYSEPGGMIYISVKDGFKQRRVDPTIMLGMCKNTAANLRLKTYRGVLVPGEGTCWIYTNI